MTELKDSYDVIVIGAGLGGLSCGAYAARGGLSVLVAEQHSRPGGLATSFEHQGYVFDNGQGWLMCEPGGAIYKMLEDLEMKQDLELLKMDPPLRVIGSGFDVKISSPEKMGERMIELVPEEARAVRKFVAECKSATENFFGALKISLDLMNIRQKMTFMLTAPFKLRKMLKYMMKTCVKASAGFFKDPKLRTIFLSAVPDLGPEGPGMVMVVFGLAETIRYPKGGIKALADLLAKGVRKFGGELALNTKVEKILIEGKRAAGVELSDGRKIKARYVVSNADSRQTFLKMVGEKHLSPWFRWGLGKEIGYAGFVVSLGVNMDLKKMGFNGEYICYHPSADFSEIFSFDPEKCFIGISMPSINDPSMAPKGGTSVSLYTAFPYNLVKDWKAEEEGIANKLIASAEKIIPGLSKHIVSKHIKSPFAFEQFEPGTEGTSVGWQLKPGRMELSQKTPIKNLYLAGRWTFPLSSMNMVISSGKNAAQLVLKGR